MRMVKTVIKIVVVLILLAVVGIVVLLGSMWLDHTRETTLPQAYWPVRGWAHDLRLERRCPGPVGAAGTKRELLAWIWYPAAPRQPSQTAVDYLPAPWRMAIENQSGVLFGKFLTRDLSKIHVSSIRDAEVSPQQGSYPVSEPGISG